MRRPGAAAGSPSDSTSCAARRRAGAAAGAVTCGNPQIVWLRARLRGRCALLQVARAPLPTPTTMQRPAHRRTLLRHSTDSGTGARSTRHGRPTGLSQRLTWSNRTGVGHKALPTARTAVRALYNYSSRLFQIAEAPSASSAGDSGALPRGAWRARAARSASALRPTTVDAEQAYLGRPGLSQFTTAAQPLTRTHRDARCRVRVRVHLP
eukprot:scaffold3743_cov389-Prasinococcus_capsulatus_cf.AAC.19